MILNTQIHNRMPEKEKNWGVLVVQPDISLTETLCQGLRELCIKKYSQTSMNLCRIIKKSGSKSLLSDRKDWKKVIQKIGQN